uniref:Ion_trans domain-containing protein n=1 Tax=Macrostomum lignano TaxID=282301 RepID=A0A1I8FSZ1_9PLAT
MIGSVDTYVENLLNQLIGTVSREFQTWLSEIAKFGETMRDHVTGPDVEAYANYPGLAFILFSHLLTIVMMLFIIVLLTCGCLVLTVGIVAERDVVAPITTESGRRDLDGSLDTFVRDAGWPRLRRYLESVTDIPLPFKFSKELPTGILQRMLSRCGPPNKETLPQILGLLSMVDSTRFVDSDLISRQIAQLRRSLTSQLENRNSESLISKQYVADLAVQLEPFVRLVDSADYSHRRAVEAGDRSERHSAADDDRRAAESRSESPPREQYRPEGFELMPWQPVVPTPAKMNDGVQPVFDYPLHLRGCERVPGAVARPDHLPESLDQAYGCVLGSAVVYKRFLNSVETGWMDQDWLSYLCRFCLILFSVILCSVRISTLPCPQSPLITSRDIFLILRVIFHLCYLFLHILLVYYLEMIPHLGPVVHAFRCIFASVHTHQDREKLENLTHYYSHHLRQVYYAFTVSLNMEKASELVAKRDQIGNSRASVVHLIFVLVFAVLVLNFIIALLVSAMNEVNEYRDIFYRIRTTRMFLQIDAVWYPVLARLSDITGWQLAGQETYTTVTPVTMMPSSSIADRLVILILASSAACAQNSSSSSSSFPIHSQSVEPLCPSWSVRLDWVPVSGVTRPNSCIVECAVRPNCSACTLQQGPPRPAGRPPAAGQWQDRWGRSATPSADCLTFTKRPSPAQQLLPAATLQASLTLWYSFRYSLDNLLAGWQHGTSSRRTESHANVSSRVAAILSRCSQAGKFSVYIKVEQEAQRPGGLYAQRSQTTTQAVLKTPIAAGWVSVGFSYDGPAPSGVFNNATMYATSNDGNLRGVSASTETRIGGKYGDSTATLDRPGSVLRLGQQTAQLVRGGGQPDATQQERLKKQSAQATEPWRVRGTHRARIPSWQPGSQLNRRVARQLCKGFNHYLPVTPASISRTCTLFINVGKGTKMTPAYMSARHHEQPAVTLVAHRGQQGANRGGDLRPFRLPARLAEPWAASRFRVAALLPLPEPRNALEARESENMANCWRAFHHADAAEAGRSTLPAVQLSREP